MELPSADERRMVTSSVHGRGHLQTEMELSDGVGTVTSDRARARSCQLSRRSLPERGSLSEDARGVA